MGPGTSLLGLGGGLPAADPLVIRLECPADGAGLSHAALVRGSHFYHCPVEGDRGAQVTP